MNHTERASSGQPQSAQEPRLEVLRGKRLLIAVRTAHPFLSSVPPGCPHATSCSPSCFHGAPWASALLAIFRGGRFGCWPAACGGVLARPGRPRLVPQSLHGPLPPDPRRFCSCLLLCQFHGLPSRPVYFFLHRR